MKVNKVRMNIEGKVSRTEISCIGVIDFEFYLDSNRKASISTKNGELIVFLDNMEIIQTRNKIKIT